MSRKVVSFELQLFHQFRLLSKLNIENQINFKVHHVMKYDAVDRSFNLITGNPNSVWSMARI